MARTRESIISWLGDLAQYVTEEQVQSMMNAEGKVLVIPVPIGDKTMQSLGGKACYEKYGPEFYAENGRKGMAKRWGDKKKPKA